MKWVEVNKKDFFDAVNSIHYRNQDIREAQQFGCKNVPDCYHKANKAFARYFLVLDDGTPVVTVMLQRDGHIVFFISKDISSPIKLIRTLRRLARKQTSCVYPIITRTANWYDEAVRINKLIGFSLWKESEKSSLWIYPSIKVLQERLKDRYGWKN